MPALLQAYNNTEHICTGLTPHFVLHGRHARLPVEMATGAPHTSSRYNLDGWVESHHQTLLKAYQQVATQTRQRQQKDKARYDLRAKNVPLLPGERVLLRNFRRHDQGKLAPHWQPTPYVVVCQMGPHQPVYKIRPEGKVGPEKTIHRNNIRPCPLRPQPPPSPSVTQPTSGPEAAGRLPVAPLCLMPIAPARAPAVPEPVRDAAPQPIIAAAPEVQQSPRREPDEQEPSLRRSTRETRGRTPVRYRQ